MFLEFNCDFFSLKDKAIVIMKCPFLINEMVNTVSNIIGALSSNYQQKSIFSLVNNDESD
jgi:hypothetical protein